MPGVLLIGSPKTSWREWLRTNRRSRDLIIADPAESGLGPPGRLSLWRGDKLLAWRFYGALSPVRAPHVLLGAVVELMRQASDDAVVQLFPYRPLPLMRQLSQLIAEVIQPAQILIASDVDIDLAEWPVGPEEVDLEPAFPPLVEAAQRRAQWLRLFQECSDHEIPLRGLTIEGARLGSGVPMSDVEIKRLGLENVLHVEICGNTLYVVSDDDVSESQMGRALDTTHTSKGHVVAPERFLGLLCSFARTGGEDFGIGAIREIDFAKGIVHAACDAVAPAPVQILRIGGLRVSPDGQELGEARPWEI